MSVASNLGNRDFSLPVGAIIPFAGLPSNAAGMPFGWLPCGTTTGVVQSFLPADYPELYAVIGTTFGNDGAGGFLLPQFNNTSNYPKGVAVNDGVTDAGTAGTANVSFTLTESNMPNIDFPPRTTAPQTYGVVMDSTTSTWTDSINPPNGVGVSNTAGITVGESDDINCLPTDFTTRNFIPSIQTDPTLSRTNAAPTTHTSSLTLTTLVPPRYQVPFIIKYCSCIEV